MTATKRRTLCYGTALSLVGALGCAGSNPMVEIRRTETFEKALARQHALYGPPAQPENSIASLADHLTTGDIHRAQGLHDKAHMAYVRAHFSDRESMAPLTRIAYLALREDPERARVLFEELVAEAPDAAELQVGLGYALAASGKLEAARVRLQHALELNPASQAALVALGVVSDRMGDPGTATQAYERALAAGHESAEILNNLGVSHLLARRLEDAVRAFERARASEPRDPVLSNNLGLALGLLGRDVEAMKAFQRAGSEGDALNNLGLAHYLRGDLSGARALFERALLSNETDEMRVLRNLERVEQALSPAGA
ncbi:MAG: tetratricopeptide repeat protein [Myxococcales bacterium]|nr:tetratricopeptide repeat protein [Myxococcales bacterium]